MQSLAMAASKGWRLFLLMSILLVSGPGQSVARPAERAPSLRLSLSTDQPTYLPGQPVHFTLTLTNPGDTDITLSFRSSQQTDFVIRRDKEEIWRWSDGRMFAQVLTQMKLGPNERRAFHAIWDQKDREVRQVPVGSYEAVGLLLAGAGRDRAITSFKIVAPTGSDHAPVR